MECCSDGDSLKGCWGRRDGRKAVLAKGNRWCKIVSARVERMEKE